MTKLPFKLPEGLPDGGPVIAHDDPEAQFTTKKAVTLGGLDQAVPLEVFKANLQPPNWAVNTPDPHEGWDLPK